MGIPVLVLGESGTGKSCSLRNFSDEMSLINVDNKMLPFPNKLKKIVSTDNVPYILQLMTKSSSKIIVIDDAQYIMANAYMNRRFEKGFDKFIDIGGSFFDIVENVKKLPQDTIVYFLMHTEETSGGTIKAKTIGKMLDEKITLEGKFTIVLRTFVKDGQFLFSTQNNGYDTVKTPMGMFSTAEIQNDLKEVDNAIRSYYGLGGTL